MQPKYGLTSLFDHNFSVQSVKRQTHIHTDRQKSKTEGLRISSTDMLYLETLIIVGEIK